MPKSSEICANIPQRWLTVFLGFFSLFNAYSMRVCLSIAITEMTLPQNNTETVNSDETCIRTSNNNNTHLITSKHSNATKYDWSEHTQGLILSSFYWGHIFSTIFGGVICQKFGGKHSLGLGVLSTSLFTLLIPHCINWGGALALIVLQVAMGLGEGPISPAISDLLAKWIPEDERSKAGSVAFSGRPLGTLFGMIVSGVILQYSKIGWPMVFYFYGTVGLISFLLNHAFCYNEPSDSPLISDEELKYLKNKIKSTHANIPPTPWRYIFKSVPVWALIMTVVGNAWVILTIIIDMPKYLSSVLKFSAQDNGYLLSIPYLLLWMSSYVISCIADKVIAKKILSITIVRKIGCIVASLGPAIFLVAASYAGCDGFLVILLQSMGFILMGCNFFCQVNILDLSPNYASSITGLVTGIAVVGGMLSPYIVGVMTPNQTIKEWRLVFWIVFAIALISSIVYLAYGSGKVQEWNDPTFLNKKRILNKEEIKEGVYLLPGNKKEKSTVNI